MLANFTITDERALELIFSVSLGLGVIVIGFILRKIAFGKLQRWSEKTTSQIDDVIVGALKGPSIIWVLMLGIYAGLAYSGVSERAVSITGKVLFILGALSVTLVVANILSGILKTYANKVGNVLPGTSLTENIIRILVLATGVLVILNSLGVSITPILATLGVGGLAVALALQDTLSNLFAGFHISINQMLRVGDYVKLESGDEGYVMDISSRTTKIKMGSNNVIMVPNAKVTQTIITNYYYPDKEVGIGVNLGVHYKSDLKKVEKITCEVAKDVMREVAGGIPEFNPCIRYNGFGDSSVTFSVALRCREFTDQFLIKHEFIKRLHERYKKEGIVIPYPVRAINYEQEGVK